MIRKLLLAAVACAAITLPAAAQAPVTPRAGDTVTIVTGGTAVTVLSGPMTGCYIVNPLSATDQGIATAEAVYINPVGAATTTGNGSNVTIQPGQAYNCIPMSVGPVSANAATSGHKLVVVRW